MVHSNQNTSLRQRLPMLFLLVALFVVPAAAFAFSFAITQNSKTAAGTSRIVNMAGTYTLSAGDIALTSVYINTLDSSMNFLSSAHGSSTGSTWAAGVGDFALAYYYVEFKVSTTTGTRTYRTPVYAW